MAILVGGRDRDTYAHDCQRPHGHGGDGLTPAGRDGLGCGAFPGGQTDEAERPGDARPELARGLGHRQGAVPERGLAQREQRCTAIRARRDVRLEVCARLGRQRAVGMGREVGQPALAGAGNAGWAQFGQQMQPGRADEAWHSLLLDVEDGCDLVVGPALEVAQDEHRTLLRREPLVGHADLALRRATGAEGLAVALEGQSARRGIQMRGHVERVEPALGQVRERTRERQLDQRSRRLIPACEPVAEAIDAALVGRIEQLERAGVAALHAAHQRPSLTQFALARLVPGDRHRLVNPN